MNKSLALLTASLLLAGCQTLAPTPDGTPPVEDATASKAPAAPQQYASFSEDTLYSLLAAELAGQRNRFDIALGNYVQQANATQDPGVAERSFRIAEYLGAEQAALDSALIWSKSAPDSVDAQRAAAVQLARAGRYDESMQFMEKVLQGQGDTHFDFLALSAAETDPDTRAGLLQSFDRLLHKYPENGQLLFGKALLLHQDGRAEEALELLEDHAASEEEIPPLLLRARLLQSLNRGEEALPLLKKGIKRYPEDKRVRLAYARQLVELRRLDDAKSEFAGLVQQFPDDDDLRYSLALVCLEAEAWDEAAAYLEELVARNAHTDAAHFNLGRIYEQRGDQESALLEYALVGPGDDYLPAQVRQTEILFDGKRAAEASNRLGRSRESQPDYAVQLYLIESEALANRERLDESWRVIDQALGQFPGDTNLLYTRAMLSDRRGDLAGLERDLRGIIEREPDNATALNALGYTLADRTTRYEEARALIERAHMLNPGDPVTLDSLGWINYRLGNLDVAERHLRAALLKFPDHEVAAHLGEVLWAQGKQREAREVWAKALEAAPDSPILRSTIQRLTGSEKL